MKKLSKKAGVLFVLVGPSRVGKNAILKRLLARKSLQLRDLITTTTRARRTGEKDGRDYYFVSNERFDEMIAKDEFLEWVFVQTHRSGSPKEPVFTWLKNGQNVVADLDVVGAEKLQATFPYKIVTIFILPGSISDLRRRLNSSIKDSHERSVRWETMKKELGHQPQFRYRIVNEQGKLDMAVSEVVDIIKAHSC